MPPLNWTWCSTLHSIFQDEEWRRKLAEVEEQMQLAIEEREMQKVAAITEYDRRSDEQSARMEELKTVRIVPSPQ